MSGRFKAASAPSKVKGKFTVKAAAQSKRGAAKYEKRKRPSADDDDEASADNEMSDEEDYGDEDDDESGNTDDEIAAAHAGKSKKTSKRKRRATSPSTFGATLQSLLGGSDAIADAGPSQPSAAQQPPAILSLAPHVRRGAQSSRLNAKAARIALAARRKREDRAHVTDVIGAWGAPGVLPKTSEGDEKPATQLEMPTAQDDAQRIKTWLDEGGVQGYEKRLRKVAQRGVVKLFNAIRAAQNTTADDLDETAPVAATASKKSGGGGTKGENPLGGKMKAVNELSKNNFFDLLRGGTKAA